MDRNLLDVNDDCLVEIFKYLTLGELADVASTCTRFRSIARDVFSHRYKLNGLETNMNIGEPNGYPTPCQQTASIIRNFGDLFTKLRVCLLWRDEEAKNYNTVIFNMMAKYCTGTFERLELRNCYDLQLNKIIDRAALFRNVKELFLSDSPAIGSSFLTDAKQLTRISLSGLYCKDVTEILSNDYPQLQAITLDPWRGVPNGVDIVPFLKRHPNVIELELNNSNYYDLSEIGECHWLRKLTVWDCEIEVTEAISELNKLVALKFAVFDLGLPPADFLTATKSHQTLQELAFPLASSDDYSKQVAAFARFTNLTNLSVNELDKCDDEFLAALHCLKKLRSLSIGSNHLSLTSDGLVGLVRQLPKLEELSLYPDNTGGDHFDLSESTYLKICEICRNRSQKLVIYGFDITDEWAKNKVRKEPFAGFDQHEFVQFVSLESGYFQGTKRTV